jgi:hypothetical protein
MGAGMNLAVGFPLYKQVSATFFAKWMNMDTTHVTTTITINGAYVIDSVVAMVERALILDNWDRLVIFEHDMIPPSDALTRIARYTPEQAVVGSMYFGHPIPHTAIVYIEQSDGAYDPISPDTVRDWCANPQLYRCDAVGFGFTSIARRVLEDWPLGEPMFATSKTLGSHDLWFCKRAREQGHHVYVDTGIVCDHLTEVPIGYADNQQMAHMIDVATIQPFDYTES